MRAEITLGSIPATDNGCPTRPDFLLSVVGLTNFMRLSLKKAAHANMGGAAYRKSGISLVFREMWDTRTLMLLADRVESRQCSAVVPHISRKTSEIWAPKI